MKILDEDSGKTLDSVLLMLTLEEAKELTDKLEAINPKYGEHVHVNDMNFTKSITVLIYTPDNLSQFSKRIQAIIKDENSGKTN